jgi:site-specific DNA-cytosine methylase
LSLCRDSQFGRAARTVTTRNATACTNDALRLHLPDGRVRSFSVREVAAIQSFPSTYSFDGVSRQRALAALGNAFPRWWWLTCHRPLTSCGGEWWERGTRSGCA